LTESLSRKLAALSLTELILMLDADMGVNNAHRAPPNRSSLGSPVGCQVEGRPSQQSRYPISETIDTAILDLWLGKSAETDAEGWLYHPWSFARDFHQQFVAAGSRVDVWEGDSFKLA
jgi:hypothetical protein